MTQVFRLYVYVMPKVARVAVDFNGIQADPVEASFHSATDPSTLRHRLRTSTSSGFSLLKIGVLY